MTGRPRVVVYGTPWCGYSARARHVLESRGIAYEFVDLDSRPGLRDELEAVSGNRTVPQVLIDGRPVGGYDDLLGLERDGELERLSGRRDA